MLASVFHQTEIYCHGSTLLLLATSATLYVTMFGMWSVTGEVSEREWSEFIVCKVFSAVMCVMKI